MKPATGSSSSREATKNWRPSQLRAYTKLTDEVGVCIGTSGPGAIHLLNGLYEAKLDHRPMVATAGQQVRVALGSSYIQEIDLLSLFTDVAHGYVQYCMAPRAGSTPDRPDHAYRQGDRAGHLNYRA